LGVTYHHAGHFTAAINHYMKALPLLGDDPETMVSVLVSLAEAQRDQGDINAAIATFSQVR
jgi:cytochrome c-type biogenesis protein CcmH/NrfG